MGGQFKEVHVWKCLACGRVLTTPKGIESHKNHCKYIALEIPGQISLFDNCGKQGKDGYVKE